MSVNGNHPLLAALRQPGAPPDPLARLCAALQEALGGDGALSAVREELARALGDRVRSVAADLRRELADWDGAAESLARLAGSPFLPDAALASLLGERLERSRAELARALDALEALPGADAGPSASSQAIEPQPPTLPVLRIAPSSPESPSPEPVPTPPLDPRAPVRLMPTPEADALCRRAEEHSRRGELDAAESLLTEALRLAPGYPVALRRRGAVRLMRRRFEGAEEDFSAVLVADPADAEALAGRGDALASLGRGAEAVADYTRALKLEPDRYRTRFNRAVVYRQQQEHRLALVEFTELIAARPDSAAAYFNRGLVYLAAGDPEHAAADFARVLELEPGHPAAAERRRQANREAQRRRAATSAETREEARSPTEPTRPGPPAPAAPRTPPTPAAGGAGVDKVQVRCPNCGEGGAIRWDNLAKILSCRGCGRWYRVTPHGGLVEVVQTPDGRWVDKAAYEAARRRKSPTRRWLLRTVPAACLLLAAGLGMGTWKRQAPAATEPELPKELKPRAELFARSWLVRDVPGMRRLTAPTHDRVLYSWFVRHSPPATDGPAKCESVLVEVNELPGRGEFAAVKVRLRGVNGLREVTEAELELVWERRGDTWYCVPNPR